MGYRVRERRGKEGQFIFSIKKILLLIIYCYLNSVN